jgi:flagellar hook-length control protein FliK
MLAQNIAPKPAALPPAAQPSLPANSAGGPSFAQFLTDQTALPAPPPQTDPEPSQPDDAAEPAQAAPAATTPRRATAQTAKPAAPPRTADAAAKTDAKAAAADKTGTQAATDAVTAAAEEDDAPETPQLKEFTQLIGLTAPSQPDMAATAAKPDAHRSRAAAADDAAPGRPALHAVTADSSQAADSREAAVAKPADLRADKPADRAATEPLQVTTKQALSDQPGAAPAPAPSFAAALAQALPTPTAMPDTAPAATYAAVQAPLQGSAFAPELGARVSLLAVDGVQHAELQLNPADMGPVSVQITVDGNQAQVSFHAVQAETRQALEQSLPDLAAALQGQGLTLSGGGVFQQAPRDADHGEDRSDGDRVSSNSRGGNGRIGGGANMAAAPVRRSVGLLDTFA